MTEPLASCIMRAVRSEKHELAIRFLMLDITLVATGSITSLALLLMRKLLPVSPIATIKAVRISGYIPLTIVGIHILRLFVETCFKIKL